VERSNAGEQRAAAGEDRPLPFVLRVAEWMSIDEAPSDEDSQYLFRRQAALTGDLTLTDAGKDVSFTDVGV
jgi:hypothetical protein